MTIYTENKVHGQSGLNSCFCRLSDSVNLWDGFIDFMTAAKMKRIRQGSLLSSSLSFLHNLFDRITYINDVGIVHAWIQR